MAQVKYQKSKIVERLRQRIKAEEAKRQKMIDNYQAKRDEWLKAVKKNGAKAIEGWEPPKTVGSSYATSENWEKHWKKVVGVGLTPPHEPSTYQEGANIQRWKSRSWTSWKVIR